MAHTKMRVQLIGVEQMQHDILRYSEKKEAEIRSIVHESAMNIEAEAKKRAPVNTGRLRSSIRVTYINKRLVAEILSSANYSIFVEFGTSPHFPPLRPLNLWAKRKNIFGVGFVVARAIARKGTRSQPFLFPAFEQERPKFVRQIKKGMKKR